MHTKDRGSTIRLQVTSTAHELQLNCGEKYFESTKYMIISSKDKILVLSGFKTSTNQNKLVNKKKYETLWLWKKVHVGKHRRPNFDMTMGAGGGGNASIVMRRRHNKYNI